MKKIVLMLVAAFFMGGMAMAQQANCGDKVSDPKERAERMTKRMAKEYSLNDAQKKQLLDVNLAFVEKMGDSPMHCCREMKKGKNACESRVCAQSDKHHGKGYKVDGKEDRTPRLTDEQCAKRKTEMQKKHEEMKAARTAYNTELQKIMTEDQYAAYSKRMQERKEKMESKGEAKMEKKDFKEKAKIEKKDSKEKAKVEKKDFKEKAKVEKKDSKEKAKMDKKYSKEKALEED